jgi:hypothetical protein
LQGLRYDEIENADGKRKSILIHRASGAVRFPLCERAIAEIDYLESNKMFNRKQHQTTYSKDSERFICVNEYGKHYTYKSIKEFFSKKLEKFVFPKVPFDALRDAGKDLLRQSGLTENKIKRIVRGVMLIITVSCVRLGGFGFS